MKVFLYFVISLFSTNAFAQWNTNTNINTTVVLAPKSQNNVHSVTDSKGGIIMVWDDNRNSSSTDNDIYIQRLNSSGFEMWLSNGSVICGNDSNQTSPSIIDAGDGSAIITWQDKRAGNQDIYAQKIDSSGNTLWTTNGVAVCSKTTSQKNPKIVGDNAGGAFIVWEDSLSFYWDIYAQHISSSGANMWAAGGVSICSSSNTQINPKLDVDGLGGAIFTWQDKRNNIDYDIYAQRIDAAGTVQWTTNGVLICNATNTQSNPRIEPDGSNGAVIGWIDKRNGTDYNVYTQRINSSGAVQWASNGVSVCGASNNQSALEMKYIGSSGVVFSWKDERTGIYDVYTQLVSLAGTSQLTANGIKISSALKSINPNTISDGNGGAIIAWQDSTVDGWNISSQKLNSSGVIQWANGGVVVSDALDDQKNVGQVSDLSGGVIYAWDDHRSGTNDDIYAHHLYADGTAVGTKELLATGNVRAICFPNPISSDSRIQLKNNTFSGSWELSIYDAYGSLIKKQQLRSNESYSLNVGDYATGVYFYSINLENESITSKGCFISIQ